MPPTFSLSAQTFKPGWATVSLCCLLLSTHTLFQTRRVGRAGKETKVVVDNNMKMSYSVEAGKKYMFKDISSITLEHASEKVEYMYFYEHFSAKFEHILYLLVLVGMLNISSLHQ